MTDETRTAEAADAKTQTQTDRPATPAAAAAPSEAQAAPRATEANPPARKPAVSKPVRAAKPAKKPVAARKTKTKSASKPATPVKAKPAAKPARKRKISPARAGATRTQGVETMTKQTRDGLEAGLFATDQFKTVFGDVNERAKAAAERSAKVVEELADLTRGNVEAFVASSKVAAKGVETLSQEAAEYSRKSFEEASAAFKSFAEVKSPTDFFKLQGDFVRAAFDNAVAESARVSETVLKLAGDVAEPITSRYNVAAERVKTLAA